MIICFSHLLPTPRSLRPKKVQLGPLLRSRICLQDGTIAPTFGTRCFAKCSNLPRREFGKKQTKDRSKRWEAEPQSATQGPLPFPTHTSDLAAWIDALEPFLPPHLRTSLSTGQSRASTAREKSAAITHVLAEARKSNAEIDVLAELCIKHGRWSAVLSVVETLIADATDRTTHGPLAQLPSNLDWPLSIPLDELAIRPIRLDETSYSDSTSPAQRDKLYFDPQNADGTVTEKQSPIQQIWMSLGSIILDASDLPPEKFNQVMTCAYQIIARLHNFGFVPDQVYSYVHTSYESTPQRPPIMHLLASRILTTLSDAVWRAHQDEAIAQAASAGATYRDLGHDPPGGRFRLKVRDLGPEVWLEFVLWCCVDGGYSAAGSWIVERIRTRKNASPWFATKWTSGIGEGASEEALVDWARVKLRHGGTVGQIEGYSRERPFVEMQPRTISVEVVLALVEASINARSHDAVGRGCTEESAQTAVSKLLMFLEPHSLPPRYLDYLAVRLLQPVSLDFEKDVGRMQSLVEQLKSMRSLETTHKLDERLPSLEIGCVLEQSEVYAGVLHQALESLAIAGRIRPTVEMFSQIQELVDQSRLRAISSFLRTSRTPDQSFFSSRDFPFSDEYTSSHGQLPVQKLAPFLDIATEAGLSDLGQWLLFSIDVDGPMIPLNLYSRSSLTPSLLRFAAATQNRSLVEDIADMVGRQPRKPSVSYFRSYADARLHMKDFENAAHAFAALNEAKGGGNNVYNIAHIIATMIRIEHSAEHSWEERRPRLLLPGLSLLDWLLKGDFRGTVGDFRKEQISDYRRSLGCLLRVVEAIPGTVLSDVARSWIPTIGVSNVTGLHPRIFGIVLSAVVETKGAKVGMMLWDLFCCEQLAQEGKKGYDQEETADANPVSTPNGLELQPSKAPLADSPTRSPNTILPVSIDKSKPGPANGGCSGMNIDDPSEDAMITNEYDVETTKNGREVGMKIGNAEIEETSNNVSRSKCSRAPQGGSGLAENIDPLRGDPFVPGEQDSTLPQNAPDADIAFLPAEFASMITEESAPSGYTDDDVFPLTSSPSPPEPVVRPTLRTLRIIIRSALQELEAAKAIWYIEDVDVSTLNTSDIPAKANMRALEAAMTDIALVEQWARPLFRRFSITDDDVAAEIGWELRQTENIFSTNELKKRYGVAHTEYELAKMGMLADMSEVNIRKRFLGPPIRKAGGVVKKYTKREVAFYFNEGKAKEEGGFN